MCSPNMPDGLDIPDQLVAGDSVASEQISRRENQSGQLVGLDQSVKCTCSEVTEDSPLQWAISGHFPMCPVEGLGVPV